MTFKGMNIGDRATLTQVEIYVCEKGYMFEPIDFFNKYEKKNWLTLKGHPIVSLEAAIDSYNSTVVNKEKRRQKKAYFNAVKREIKAVKKTARAIKEENKKPSPYSKYSDQLSDPRWKAFRQFVFAVRGKTCEVCGAKDYLQVHHLGYKKNLKAWEYTVNDVMVVCGDCHKKIHNIK